MNTTKIEAEMEFYKYMLNMSELGENSIEIRETPREMNPYSVILCDYENVLDGFPVFLVLDSCDSIEEAKTKAKIYDFPGSEPVTHINCFVAGLPC